MPKRTERCDCVPESVLRADGEVQTIMLDERYTPYASQGARIENLCGVFKEPVAPPDISPVLTMTLSAFGRQREVFNVHGNAAIHHGRANFMGVRSAAGLEGLARGLNLTSVDNAVHMAVMCGKTGQRVQVSASGLLENVLLNRFARHLRVEGRMYDQTNTVRLSIHTFCANPDADPNAEGVFYLPRAYWPDRNDWTVTGRGTVMTRFTWRKHRVEWTRECEAACLALCNSVMASCLRTHPRA